MILNLNSRAEVFEVETDPTTINLSATKFKEMAKEAMDNLKLSAEGRKKKAIAAVKVKVKIKIFGPMPFHPMQGIILSIGLFPW